MDDHPSTTTDVGEGRIALLGSLLFAYNGVWTLRLFSIARWYLFLPALLAPLVLVLAVRSVRKTLIPRTVIIGCFIVLLLATTFGVQMIKRAQTGPTRFIHDGAVQTEDSVTFLTAGVNPYSADYRQSPFGGYIDTFSQGVRPNPAWTHYVYLPFLTLASVPFSVGLRSVTGWFDERVVFILAELLAVVMVVRLARGREWRLLIGSLFLLNPIWTNFFVIGFNDVFMFALLAGCLASLQRRQWLAAGIWYGLAAASKQSAWLFAPFFLAYLVWGLRASRRQWGRSVAAAALTAAIIIGPFFLWDPQGFIDDVWKYPTGSAEWSYPIAGSGFGPWLVRWGFIKSRWDYYPFGIIQAVVGLPLLGVLLWRLKRSPTLARMILFSVVFGFVWWFFSRYYNNNYYAYFTFLLIAGLAAAGPPRWLRGRIT